LKAKGRLARILVWGERNVEEAERLAREATEGTRALESPAEDFASYHEAVWAGAVRLRREPEVAEAMIRLGLTRRGDRLPQPPSAWVEAYQHLQLALCLRDEGREDDALETM